MTEAKSSAESYDTWANEWTNPVWDCAYCGQGQGDGWCENWYLHDTVCKSLLGLTLLEVLKSQRRYGVSTMHWALFTVHFLMAEALLCGLKPWECRGSELPSKYITTAGAPPSEWIWVAVWQTDRFKAVPRKHATDFIIGDTPKERTKTLKKMRKARGNKLIGFAVFSLVTKTAEEVEALNDEETKWWMPDCAWIKFRYEVVDFISLNDDEVVDLPKRKGCHVQPQFWESHSFDTAVITAAFLKGRKRYGSDWMRTPDVFPEVTGKKTGSVPNAKRLKELLSEMDSLLQTKVGVQNHVTRAGNLTIKGVTGFFNQMVNTCANSMPSEEAFEPPFFVKTEAIVSGDMIDCGSDHQLDVVNSSVIKLEIPESDTLEVTLASAPPLEADDSSEDESSMSSSDADDSSEADDNSSVSSCGVEGAVIKPENDSNAGDLTDINDSVCFEGSEVNDATAEALQSDALLDCGGHKEMAESKVVDLSRVMEDAESDALQTEERMEDSLTTEVDVDVTTKRRNLSELSEQLDASSGGITTMPSAIKVENDSDDDGFNEAIEGGDFTAKKASVLVESVKGNDVTAEALQSDALLERGRGNDIIVTVLSEDVENGEIVRLQNEERMEDSLITEVSEALTDCSSIVSGGITAMSSVRLLQTDDSFLDAGAAIRKRMFSSMQSTDSCLEVALQTDDASLATKRRKVSDSSVLLEDRSSFAFPQSVAENVTVVRGGDDCSSPVKQKKKKKKKKKRKKKKKKPETKSRPKGRKKRVPKEKYLALMEKKNREWKKKNANQQTPEYKAASRRRTQKQLAQLKK